MPLAERLARAGLESSSGRLVLECSSARLVLERLVLERLVLEWWRVVLEWTDPGKGTRSTRHGVDPTRGSTALVGGFVWRGPQSLSIIDKPARLLLGHGFVA